MPKESHQARPGVDFLRNIDHFHDLIGAFAYGLYLPPEVDVLGNILEAIEEVEKTFQFKSRTSPAKMNDVLLPIFLDTKSILFFDLVQIITDLGGRPCRNPAYSNGLDIRINRI